MSLPGQAGGNTAMVTNAECRREILDLIAYYEERGWDWLLPLEFTVRKHSGSWPEVYWWQRKQKREQK